MYGKKGGEREVSAKCRAALKSTYEVEDKLSSKCTEHVRVCVCACVCM